MKCDRVMDMDDLVWRYSECGGFFTLSFFPIVDNTTLWDIEVKNNSSFQKKKTKQGSCNI